MLSGSHPALPVVRRLWLLQPSAHGRGQPSCSSSKGQEQPFKMKAPQLPKGIWWLCDLGQVT